MIQSPHFRWKYILYLIWKSRSQSLDEEWRGTESMLLEVQCEVSTVSDNLGCHVICWCWSTVFSEVHSQRSHLPGNFRALHASFCWQALWRCWFSCSSRTWHLPTLSKGTKSWFNDHGVTVLDWLENSPDQNPRENLWAIVKRKMRDTRPNNCRRAEGRYQSNLGFHYTWAVPQADCLHATPHWCSNSCKRRPNQVLSASKRTHFSEAQHCRLNYPLFYWYYVILQFSETLNFGFSLSESHNHKKFKK